LKQNGVKINYAQFLLNTQEKKCRKAVKHISGKIDLNKINSIIEETPFISDIHKVFLKFMIKERKEKIVIGGLENGE